MYQKVCMLSFLGYFIILYDVNASDVWYFVVTLSPGGIHTQVEKKAKCDARPKITLLLCKSGLGAEI